MPRARSSVDDLSVFLKFDYSQIELRMLAELSGDKLLILQFQRGEDIHCAVGHELTGWPVERIAKDKRTRRLVKNMHFAIVFGVLREGLYDYVVVKIQEEDGENADLTGVTRPRLVKLYDAYFLKYRGVARYVQKQRDKADRLKYVDTLFGFRREIRKIDETRGSFWGNQAINTPIQGTAHQLVLMALALLRLKGDTFNLLQQTCIMEEHDALYFRIEKTKDLQAAYAQGKQLLEQEVVSYAQRNFGYKLHVPLVAEAESGYCMGSLVDYTGGAIPEFLSDWRKKHMKVSDRAALERLLPALV